MIFFLMVLGIVLGLIVVLLYGCLKPPQEIVFSMSPAEVQRRYHEIHLANLTETMTWRSPFEGLISMKKESNKNAP